MKKLLAIPAVIALVLVIAACGDKDSDPGSKTPNPSSSNGADGPLGQVKWIDGETPSLEFPIPFNMEPESAFRIVKAGDGDEVRPGSVVLPRFVLYNAADGTEEGSTYEGGQDVPIIVASEEQPGYPFWQAMNGQRVGAELIVAWKAEAPADASAGQERTIWLGAFTITEVRPTRAAGEVIEQTDPNLPKVTLAKSGQPSIEVPAVPAPDHLVAETLIKGDGRAVESDDSLLLNYTGWVWGGEEFDSSWPMDQPTELSLAYLIEGWKQGLVGVPVGSQMLLVIPPELGYGSDDKPNIPPNSTLIFVVDIVFAA
ncbi:MAG: FKBP-type peptidyl-prolyl cis-trans isomerase [Bifidobacteriaceae bacterium]|jgi:peptidylprolyl isomerase|nr:FKBP-type peptidyl-prolyl cis-trans isomerase [Bifidobacteriaceae bacterium]